MMNGHKIFVTGDTHIPHDIHKVNTDQWGVQKELSKEDFLVVCGDFGLIFEYQKTGQSVPSNENDRCWDRQELFWLEWLNERPFTTLFLDGNHENFDRLGTYPIADWNGGKVQFISESVIHLMRGEVYTLNGKKLFVFGGARSTDRGPAVNSAEDIKRIEHKIWWPQEIPTQSERDNALVNLGAHENKVDYIMTHEAPSSYLLKKGLKLNIVSEFLQQIWETVDFKSWYCGHHHIDGKCGNLRVLYHDVVELE